MVRITVNGVDFLVSETHITYERVVELSGQTGQPSVAYLGPRHGGTRRSGTLYPGCDPIFVEDGLGFTVAHTGNG